MAEYWCGSNCKDCFCSTCWNAVHEVGLYRNHTKVPIKDKPIVMSKCQDDHDDQVTHWCEGCNKEICKNCQTVKHADHNVIVVTGNVNPFEDEVLN